jgi:predicted MFS family arabinose efflux permease
MAGAADRPTLTASLLHDRSLVHNDEGAFAKANNDTEGSSEHSVTVVLTTSARERWATVLVLTLMATFCGTGLFIFSFLFAVDTEEGPHASMGLGEEDFGLLMSYVGIVPRLVVIVGAAVLAGLYPDHKRAMVVGSTGCLLAGLVLAYASTGFWSFAVAIVVINLGIGLNMPLSTIIVADVFERPHRALPIATITCSDYLGGGLCSPSVSLALHLGWRGAVGVYFAATLAVFLLSLVFALPNPRGHDFFLDQQGGW